MDTHTGAAEFRPELTLTEELHAVDVAWPGWHCWLSDSGAVYATRCRPQCCGVTVYSQGVGGIVHEIAVEVHEWDLAEARAARAAA